MTLSSFISVPPESHFPIQNLPYGVFSPKSGGSKRIGVAIGDHVLDLAALGEAGFFAGTVAQADKVFEQGALNAFMALGSDSWRQVRQIVQDALREDNPDLRDNAALRERVLLPMQSVTLHLPAEIADYTDFYVSKEHATNLGTLFRGKENALLPNWVHVPIAYHGRASSIVVSGTDIHRPYGQVRGEDGKTPIFTASRQMDFELEVGYFVGPGNELGHSIPIGEAMNHVFGAVLVNDWSARDIQNWEYQPLGPFLGKNLGTSISPWVVPMEALDVFRCPQPVQDPQPLPYLRTQGNWAYDISLEVSLRTDTMPTFTTVTRTNLRYAYWNICQQIAHHTITGCNLRPGDLLATGTISGPTPDSYGSLIELSWRGANPVALAGNEQRSFLEDGDCVRMTGWAQGDGFRVGFGDVTGCLLPSLRTGL
ncbi:MAG TPA: fumarylacetoacetase [Aggregatilineales bacterium]|nr:fumarylacetoacetase [Aggregatilineales bacterium]